MKAFKKDIAKVDGLYAGRKPFHGELHDHSACGDGKNTLAEWKAGMEALEMDFATIVDHHQVEHMYHRDFIDGMFLGGTEPGATITDITAARPRVHYNMLFADPKPLEQLVTEFEEYQFTGGQTGRFGYPRFTRERFTQVVQRVRELGGFFVHPHPKQLMESEDPLDYWFGDDTGLEVLYTYHQDRDGEATAANYKLWTDLLSAGKRVYATAGNDEHHMPSDKALTTLYAERRSSAAYLEVLRSGDFVAGPVGMQMCIGDTRMGGRCSFAGQRLVLRIGDLHRSVFDPAHTYRVVLYAGNRKVAKCDFTCLQPAYFAWNVKPEMPFYRAEIWDVTLNSRLAYGNPIWNEK